MVRTFGSMEQALAVFQAFSLAKLRNLRLLSQKLKFWESLFYHATKNQEHKYPKIGGVIFYSGLEKIAHTDIGPVQQPVLLNPGRFGLLNRSCKMLRILPVL
jgi:hypothetical protein